MGAHARFAPSSAHRIYDCPASLLLNEKEPDVERVEAAQGTVAHHVAEICARMRLEPEEFLGRVFDSDTLDDYDEELTTSKGFDIEVDKEMVSGIGDYLDRIMWLAGDHYIEQRVNISPWCPIPDQFGTCDHAVASPGKLVITDLKYGFVWVDAEQNKQLVMYALGFINEWDWLYNFDEVIIRIAQPRVDNWGEWHTTKAELLAIGEQIKKRFSLALKPNPPFGPSEKACRFCKVQYKCKANAKFLYENRIMLLDDDDENVVSTDELGMMDDQELASLWLRKSMYEARMKAVEDYLHRKNADGEFLPGLKVVAGKKSRYFVDAELAELFLLENGVKPDELWTEPSFVSPAQAEKLVKGKVKKNMQSLIKAKPGKPCLVSADDKRQDLTVQKLSLLDD